MHILHLVPCILAATLSDRFGPSQEDDDDDDVCWVEESLQAAGTCEQWTPPVNTSRATALAVTSSISCSSGSISSLADQWQVNEEEKRDMEDVAAGKLLR